MSAAGRAHVQLRLRPAERLYSDGQRSIHSMGVCKACTAGVCFVLWFQTPSFPVHTVIVYILSEGIAGALQHPLCHETIATDQAAHTAIRRPMRRAAPAHAAACTAAAA